MQNTLPIMRRNQTILLTVFVIGASIIGLVTTGLIPNPMSPRSLPVNTNPLRLGSDGRSSKGWLMPPNTAFSTSYVADMQLSSFVSATLNVFPYQIQSGTFLQLSLYLDSRLVTDRKYDLSGYPQSARIVGTVEGGVGNFTAGTLGFGVSKLSLSSPLPAGTKVTVVAWVNHPLWVQIDPSSTTHSYESTGLSSYSAPSVFSESTIASPYTLSVEVESSE